MLSGLFLEYYVLSVGKISLKSEEGTSRGSLVSKFFII
jgi:hypothetical protein